MLIMNFLKNRSDALSCLLAGDLIYGEAPDGPVLICIVTVLTLDTIEARRITTQTCISFDRRTGAQCGGNGQILSIEPLPLDLHAVLCRLERRMRIATILQVPALDPAERQALLSIREFYAAYPLPPMTLDET